MKPSDCDAAEKHRQGIKLCEPGADVEEHDEEEEKDSERRTNA